MTSKCLHLARPGVDAQRFEISHNCSSGRAHASWGVLLNRLPALARRRILATYAALSRPA
jgi:hypothetical protein